MMLRNLSLMPNIFLFKIKSVLSSFAFFCLFSWLAQKGERCHLRLTGQDNKMMKNQAIEFIEHISEPNMHQINGRKIRYFFGNWPSESTFATKGLGCTPRRNGLFQPACYRFAIAYKRQDTDIFSHKSGSKNYIAMLCIIAYLRHAINRGLI